MISLATSLHASPGVYALLLGSGVSTAAGIPTGWQIVSDLVRRAATAKFPDDPSAGETAAADPEAWWLKHGDGKPLGYSGLLESLASTPAARHALLAGYFEPTPEEQAEGLKAPGAAHLAVAQLVARGTVRVVLTTNFDRLLERALEALGVQPQVLRRPEQIAAATPLRHHRATIIKLHGDYADLDKRNTVDELQKYPPETQGLLRCVLDEYGLLIAGWSAEWDVALAAALEETRSRRYPLFWSFYGSSLGDTARRLVAQQGAVQMSGQTADELFGGVLARTEALDRLADPPISRAVAVTRLKRALPDPVRRIELYDLVDREVGAVVKRVQDQERYPLVIDPLTPEALEERIASLRGDTDTLLHLLASGGGVPRRQRCSRQFVGAGDSTTDVCSGRSHSTSSRSPRKATALPCPARCVYCGGGRRARRSRRRRCHSVPAAPVEVHHGHDAGNECSLGALPAQRRQ